MIGATRRGLLVLALSVATAPPSIAGPPYVTDDPEPTDTGHWENYLFTEITHVVGQICHLSCRLLTGMAGEIISEPWAKSSRNAERLHSGIAGGFTQDSAAFVPRSGSHYFDWT